MSQERDRLRFATTSNAERLAVRRAKASWFKSKAVEAEKGRHSGKVVWKCIRDIQSCRRGLLPMRSSLVKDENGNVCTTTEEQQGRWIRHFSDIVGKVVATVLQDRLQKIADIELPESQCGFRKGRSCTDMIFVVRQLVEAQL